MSKHFFVFNHQNKARAYVDALVSDGWTISKQIDKVCFILADLDIGGREKQLRHYRQRGCKIFLYPHSSIPPIYYDYKGIEFSKEITAQFVSTEGHIEIQRLIGSQYPLHTVGFSFCPVVPFRSRKLTNILFAPIHPNSTGFLSKQDKELNAETFRRLLEFTRVNHDIHLNVRYLQSLEHNGLWVESGVNFMLGEADQSYGDIDTASLVVSHHTFAYMSVARGCPTVMMGESDVPRMGGKESDMVTVQSWDKYKHLFMYPLDILSCNSNNAIMDLFQRTCETDADILDWRSRMIGNQFDASLFIDVLRSYL